MARCTAGTTGNALLPGRAVERSTFCPFTLSLLLLMMDSTITHEGTHFPLILGTFDYVHRVSMFRFCLALPYGS